MNQPTAEAVPEQSPDEQVATNIGTALLAAGLLDTSKKDDVVGKISNGFMKSSDWKSLFEMSKPKGNK